LKEAMGVSQRWPHAESNILAMPTGVKAVLIDDSSGISTSNQAE
jgi:hypothetical protein